MSTLSPIPSADAAEAPLAEDAALTQQNLIAAGESWAYLDDGTDPGPTWIDATFDDATWAFGNGQFGYGDGDETTIINYGPDPDNKYATTYFRKTITVTDVHQLESAELALTYDDGAAIYLNGARILRTENLPEGFTSTTWATANREETIPVTIDPTLFIEGDNTIAVEIHQAWRKSNDISFDLSLTVARNDSPKPPTVADDNATTDEGVAVSGTVAANDEADLTYSTATTIDPAVADLTFNSDGTWTVVPVADYVGTIVVDHTACDAAGVCSDAVLTVEMLTTIVTDQAISFGDSWAYLDDGTDPGPTWIDATFDDATWAFGNGQFGYGDGDETTIINYGPDPDNKYATTYFRKTITVTDLHQVIAASASLTYDDGAAIYLNGTRILRTENLPEGFTSTTWATANREETIPVTIDPTLFIEGDNTIAVEIHQAWRKSNDISFDLALALSRDDLPKPPTVVDDAAETDQNIAINGDVATNDEPGLTYATTTVIDPAIGIFALNSGGTWSLSPAADYLGTISIPHTACDADGVCSEAELTIVVEVVGDLYQEQIVTSGDVWSYLDTGTDPNGGIDPDVDPTWIDATFDDTAWLVGTGQFGYGDGDETTIVNYGPDPDNKYATTYFRKTINLTNAFQYTEATASLTYDDAAVVYLNGQELFNTGNLPTDFGHNSWATSNAEETVTFAIDPVLLLEGDNTLAVEVHQVWRRSIDLSFDLAIDVTRHVLPGPPAPTAIDDLAITPPGVAVTGTVGANDRANDAGALSWLVDAVDLPDPATVGELQFNLGGVDDGSFLFTPAVGYTGTVVVPYQVCNAGACDSASLSIVVIEANPVTPGLASIADPGDVTLPIGIPTGAAVVAGVGLDAFGDGDPVDLAVTPTADGIDTVLTVTGLPVGLSIDSNGMLSGTPTVAGTYPVSVYLIVDEDDSYATITFSLTIDDSALVSNSLDLVEPIAIVEPAPVKLTIDEATEVALEYQVTDGIFGYQWLPAGLTGTTDGRIVGTPTENGVWVTEISLIDLAGNVSHTSVEITVVAGAPGGRPAEHPSLDVFTLDIRPEPGQSGVLGINPDDSSVFDVRVWDMQQVGDYMYVGGEFQQVQEGENGAVVDQQFLARFNVDTGSYDPTFAPVLDGNVHALELAPRGVLLVGGEFTSIDGVANTSGLAAINPATGQVDTSFRASVERPWSANVAIVRELEVVGDLVYVGGNFSHLRDRLTDKRERASRLARLSADFGEIDLTWTPMVNSGSVYGIGIDQDRGRVLFTGSFSSVNGVAGTNRVAVVDSVLAEIIPDTMPSTAWTVLDVEYANDLVFLANGWNNQITVHNADDYSLLYQYESDGDFQFIEKVGDYIWAGCHCTQDPKHPTARVLDAATGLEVDIAFNIGGHIDGAWSVATDDRGCAWIGGDIWDGGFDIGTVWARGYARFCPPEL